MIVHQAPAGRKECNMATNEKDPVCGITVDPTKAVHDKTGDRDYSFCSDECRIRFIVNPGKYIST